MSSLDEYLKPRDDREHEVLSVWKSSGISQGAQATYVQWVRRFRDYCQDHGLDEVSHATQERAAEFARSYTGVRIRRPVGRASREVIGNAIRAWAYALNSLGEPVPPWKSSPAPQQISRVIRDYLEYRRQHRGVAPATLVRDLQVTSEFLVHLRSKGRGLRDTRIEDLDSFVVRLRKRLSRRMAATNCSALRCFLRYCLQTGRIRRDLAASVCAPRYKTWETPPRAIPWDEIRRILHVIPRDNKYGRRDYAMLLMLAAYGLGGAEVAALQLQDIDWRNKVLRVRRPKTGVALELPLLPSVAHAIAVYLKQDRPRHVTHRGVFLTVGMPHHQISTGVLRHQIRHYARKAGIARDILGSHLFRHCHASRQVDWGTPHKLLGDILGHQRPESTAVYVRVAMRRLRSVALPVPR